MTDTRRKLLIVEDDASLQRQLKWCFEDYEVLIAGNRESALLQLRRHEPPVVLQDLGLPPDVEGVTEGMMTLREIISLAPHTKVIVITGNGDEDNAVRSVGFGAYDFYQKPLNTGTLRLLVDRALHVHTLEAENRRLISEKGGLSLDGVIAVSEAMQQVCRTIEKVAPTDLSVLLLGESGTGKELMSRALHSLSNRKDARFVAINCAAIPESLLESELFGHEKGAFTGAVRTTAGKIEIADGGTLLLDEIGDMPLPLQAKVLRFLQERVVERVGGREEIPVDVRVICATNQSVSGLISEGRFREDLYYRISEITIDIPPLRQRIGGKLVLAQVLLERFSRLHGRTLRGFSKDADEAIESYHWPGNVRELENRIKSAVIMADGLCVTAADMGLLDISGSRPPLLNLRQVRQEAESKAIRRALSQARGDTVVAAKSLGLTVKSLSKLLGEYGIAADSVSQNSLKKLPEQGGEPAELGKKNVL